MEPIRDRPALYGGQLRARITSGFSGARSRATDVANERPIVVGYVRPELVDDSENNVDGEVRQETRWWTLLLECD